MSDKLSDYDFEFEESKIALRPISPRGEAKLLYFDHEIKDLKVKNYVDLLSANDLLIFNDTKVISARLDGLRRRQSMQGEVAAKISVTLLEPSNRSGLWNAMIKPLRKIEIGETIEFSPDFFAIMVGKSDGLAQLQFEIEAFSEKLRKYGRMPLPPYIESKRPADVQDLQDYQPILAQFEGAVAAPTASLHFDNEILNALKNKGVKHETITLHVGAGTFLPVQTDDVTAHKMHFETGFIHPQTAQKINQHKANGGRIIAVGTTALRLLETASTSGKLEAYDGATDIFIRPGFEFKLVDGLITNFHLPKSTLLMLVAAFVGFDEMHDIYDHALKSDYRFFSYGDSSLLTRK